MKRFLWMIGGLLALGTDVNAQVDRRPRLYLEQVQQHDGKRWFVGIMRDDTECIETAIAFNSWIMRRQGETGVHYGCRPEVPYAVAVDKLMRFVVRTWTANGDEQVQLVGNVMPDYCSAAVSAKTQAYQKARYPLRFKFECSSKG